MRPLDVAGISFLKERRREITSHRENKNEFFSRGADKTQCVRARV